MAVCSTPSEAVHFALVPGFTAYLLLFHRGAFRMVALRHVLYLGLLTAMSAGYMLAFARTDRNLAVRWSELPVAVYFLVSVHILVWIICRLISKTVWTVFCIRRGVAVGLVRQGAAAVVCGLLAVAIVMPYLASTFLTHWVKFVDTTDPDEYPGLTFEPVIFDATDGVRVGGWFIPVSYGTSDATVIVTRGHGSTKAAVLPYVQMLQYIGYNALLLEVRGQGDSEGHTSSFGVRETNDVLGALRYLTQARPNASKYVFGFGISRGALPVLAAAAADKRIRGVVIDSGSPHLSLTLDSLTRRMPALLETYVRRSTFAAASIQLGCNLLDSGPLRQIRRISPRPVLIVHGQNDIVVPVGDAQKLFAAAGRPAMLWRVPGAGHGQTLVRGLAGYASNVRKIFDPICAGGRPLHTPSQ